MFLRLFIFSFSFACLAFADNVCSNPTIDIVPSTGFILVKSRSQGKQFALKIEQSAKVLSKCSKLIFRNAPSFIGNMEFIETGEVNSKPYYSNERYNLSFVDIVQDRPFGTWLIGNVPGVDSGVGYIVAPHIHMVPIFDSDSSSTSFWHWQSKSKWEEEPETSIDCLEETHYMDIVEAAYIRDDSLVSTTLRIQDGTVLLKDVATEQWIEVTPEPSSAILMGAPTAVITPDNKDYSSCVLVNSEFLYRHWRLMFHCYNNGATELFVDFGDGGAMAGSSIIAADGALSATDCEMSRRLSVAVEGSFHWVWFVREEGAVRQVQNVLTQCVLNSNGSTVFTYYPENRRDIMERTVLAYLADVLASDGVLTLMEGRPVRVLSALSLGQDILGWMKQYLIAHEGRFGQLSSCFLYHAAIAMPPQLLYLAELVCVLIGSKPITLIQFQSAGRDHQWKFPLTIHLAQRIIAYVTINPGSSTIGYDIFKYGSDETLVVYHKNSEHLVNELIPHRQAQALHIAPYPEASKSAKDNINVYRAQIYNSWWNGFVLGYPPRFIDSYCESFHSDLSIDEKREQALMAKQDVLKYFQTNGISNGEIKLGLNPEVSQELWNYLKGSLVSSKLLL